MNNKNLKVGDKVFIKEGLVPGKYYGAMTYERNMVQGWCEVLEIFSKSGTFSVKTDDGNSWEFLYSYTPEMVDWEKTAKLNNLSWFKEITQSGESGNETTKAITQSGEEITVKNNNEENDVEKAVMLLMLKRHGFTYGDIKKEVEKVKFKWSPAIGEQFYYVSTTPTLKARALTYFTEGALKEMTDVGNCFRTKEDAEEKIEKIKEILKGE